ncbi:PREDICTED: probable cyclic nucleotide-gated ion channel 3 [Tarenaya hassleriana]|uniref:probable cyclic nucleotide-gated ion channel 3 n=1 Tax=Tarenaya hassleriana TaxID=28532 RepID=UPI00053C5C1E|nr:PREDICTED: probable cyclic nucleotide-gated ion channel 3 [Tarenaya hassleriana]
MEEGMNPRRNIVSFDKPNPERASMGVLKTVKRCFKKVTEPYKCGGEDPQDQENGCVRNWKKIFLVVAVVGLALDPLFFYIPVFERDRFCLAWDNTMKIIAVVFRTFLDGLYMNRFLFYFRGKRVLNWHQHLYLVIDILSILPLPQVFSWFDTPNAKLPMTRQKLKWVIVGQYAPRIIRTYPLYRKVTRVSGRVTESRWTGAAFNLFLYILASHVFGAFWYSVAIERKDRCWRDACKKIHGCVIENLYCAQAGGDNRLFLNGSCPLINPDQISDPEVFNFGMFTEALQYGITESRDPKKFFHCFWWGLRNLSALGQNLNIGSFIGDISFAIIICLSGLILLALLIGRMQKYLQEEKEEKARDRELWMSHRGLPGEMRERIRRYERYRWRKTGGVDEEALLGKLPEDIKQDIKSHLCLNLLKKVPLFKILDVWQLNAISILMKPVFYSQNSYIVQQGEAIENMLFIQKGNLSSHSFCLVAGDFCCEDLLKWALSLPSSPQLPISSNTIWALTDVKGFVLSADDLEFVATRYSWFHCLQFRHMFRYHSAQQRRWAACFIQTAWRTHRRRKLSVCSEGGQYQNKLQK